MKGLAYLSVGLATLALKVHYSGATVDELAWILHPTAAAVGWLVGQPLRRNPDLGWVAADGSFVIAPACAGVNFLILAFALPAAGFAHRFRSPRERWAWIAGVAAAAYALTIVVNVVRIVLAVELYRMDVHAGWLTAERVHRLAGTVVYLIGLWAAWLGGDRLSAASAGEWRGLIVVPAAYLSLTVALPFANGAWRQFGARYLEHAATVSVLTLATVALLSLTRWFTTARRDGEAIDPGRRG